MKTIRIGAGMGYWGNGCSGAKTMVERGNIQYLCSDGLSELTLAILKKSAKKNAYAGWVNELTQFMETVLVPCKEKGIKIICNHGGLNPVGAIDEIKRIAGTLGVTGLKVAAVTGDNVYDKLEGWHAAGVDLSNFDTHESYENIKDRVMFVNAYIGAWPIVEALQNGADIVITGRCADSALFLAPMIYELGWNWDDVDKLAAGTLVGHLLECSAQSTGGNFLGDWQSIERMGEIGYPIAEVMESGDFIITKPEDTGGRVDVETVSEQMLYETLDPHNYMAPDVIADFTTPTLTDLGNDRVLVTGMKGKPRPQTLKVFLGYQNGWASSKMVLYSWPDVLQKAKRLEEILRWHIQDQHLEVDELNVSMIGVNSVHGATAPIPPEDEINEAAVKVTIRTKKREDAQKFIRIGMSLDGPPATAGSFGFAGKPRELLGPWSTLVDRNEIEPDIAITYGEV